MDFTASVFAVLTSSGKPVGTGFLAAPTLAVTCAHVIQQAGAVQGETVQIQFHGREETIAALISTEYWSDVGQSDVAILELPQPPQGIFPLRLAAASATRPGSGFRSFGYATAADVQGIHANGTIDGYLPAHQLLQLQSTQSNEGISGAPVLAQSGVVLGLITKGHQQLGRNENTTFATPSETIWQVCPQLKPIVSPLPRRNPIVEGINLLPYDYDQRIQNFLTEYLGTDSHPVPFGGRDDALKMLDAWLADTTPYLLLAAPAGRGKSALLVRWLDSLKAREDLSLAFLPVSIRFGTNMERVFYAALSARLAFLHGDDIPASPETSTAVYRGLVSNYLSKPLANGRTLLVVLDGLDEAADWQAGADFMPGELPAGVRVVVSARFLAGDADSTPWLRRLNWERNGLASAPFLTPLDQEGVRDVLFRMGCPLDELSRQVDIVAELYRLSEGDPLLVGLYVGDLWAKGEEVTRLKPEDLASIQPGYKGYFDRWWSDQKKLWGTNAPVMQNHVQVILNILSASIGSITKEDIMTLENDTLNSYIIDDAIDVMKRFVISDVDKQGFTFSHPKLGIYFWERLTKKERDIYDNKFLSWGKRIISNLANDSVRPSDVPNYIVRYYGAHLDRNKANIEEYLFFLEYYWARTWFFLEGAYGGYLVDIERVWMVCEEHNLKAINQAQKAPWLGQQLRCYLIETSLHSLAANLDASLLVQLIKHKIWSMSQSIAYIKQIPDDTTKSQAIISIGAYLQSDLFSEVLKIINELNLIEAKILTLEKLAFSLQNNSSLQEKVFENILDILDNLILDDLRSNENLVCNSLNKFAKYLRNGLNKRAMSIAKKIESNLRKDQIFILLLPNAIHESLVDILSYLNNAANKDLHIQLVINLIPYLSRNLQNALIHKTIDDILIVQDFYEKAFLIEALSPYIPSVFFKRIYRNISVDLKKKPMPYTQALCSMISKMNMVLTITNMDMMTGYEEYDSTIICTIAPYLPPNLLPEIAEYILKFKNVESFSKAMCGVVPKLQIDSLLLLIERISHDPESTTYHITIRFLAMIESAMAYIPPENYDGILLKIKSLESPNLQADGFRIVVPYISPKLLPELFNYITELDIREDIAAELFLIIIPKLASTNISYILQTTSKFNSSAIRSKICARIFESASCLPVNKLPEIIDFINYIDNEGIKSYAIKELASFVPREMCLTIVKIALSINKIEARFRALIYVFPHLAVEEKPDVLKNLYVTLHEMRYSYSELRFATTIKNLSNQIPNEILLPLVIASESMCEINHRNDLLSVIIPKVTKDQSLQILEKHLNTIEQVELREFVFLDIVKKLGIYLANELPEKTLEIAKNIGDNQMRYIALEQVGQLLPEKYKKMAYVEMLAFKMRIGDDAYIKDFGYSLIPYLPPLLASAELEKVKKLPSEFHKVDILTKLIPVLEPELLSDVISFAQNLNVDENISFVLQAYVNKCKGNNLSKILTTGMQIDNPYRQSLILSSLIPYLQHEKSASVTETILKLIDKIDIPNEKLEIMCLIFPYLAIDQHKQSNFLNSLLLVAADVRSPLIRAKYITKIIPYLDSISQKNVISASFSIIDQIDDAYQRSDSLCNLLEVLPISFIQKSISLFNALKEPYRSEALLLITKKLLPSEESLNILNLIENEEAYSQVIIQVADQLPSELIPLVSKHVEKFTDPYLSILTLSALAAHFSQEERMQLINKIYSDQKFISPQIILNIRNFINPDQLVRTIYELWDIKSKEYETTNRGSEILQLTKLTMILERKHIYICLSKFLHMLARRDRAKFITTCTDYLLLIQQIDSDNLFETFNKSLNDVTTWWP